MNPIHVAAAVAGLALLGTVAAVSIGSNFSNNKKEKTRAENDANIEMANQSNELVKSISTESQEIDVLVS
jgi:ribonuclease PH